MGVNTLTLCCMRWYLCTNTKHDEESILAYRHFAKVRINRKEASPSTLPEANTLLTANSFYSIMTNNHNYTKYYNIFSAPTILLKASILVNEL